MRLTGRESSLLLLTFLAALAYAGITLGQEAYRLVPTCTIFSGSDPPYQLTNEQTNEIPPTLMGIMLAQNGLFLCDDITRKLVKLDCEGTEVFAVGSVGEGPEDHAGPGEPIMWPGCAVARTDCTISPKLICYNEDGTFIRSISMKGFHEYLRIIRGKTRGFGIALNMHWYSGRDLGLDVYLAAIADDGALIDSLLVKRRRLALTPQITEEELEVTPRLVCDGAGRLYMQRDPYKWEIECFDEDLNLLWRRSRDVPLLPWSEDEPREPRPHPAIPAVYHHVIRQIYPRPNGAVWVHSRKAVGAILPDELKLESLDRNGEDAGEIVITGVPEEAGDILILGQAAIWKRRDDAHVAEQARYIEVYKLESVSASSRRTGGPSQGR